LAERIAGHRRLSWKLWAANGRNSAQSVALLERQEPEAFDAVLISLGVNDVTGGVSLKQWLMQTQRLADLLNSKFSARQIIFSSLPPMHHFPALPQPLRWALGERAKTFNRALQAFVATRSDCRLLHFDAPMQAEFMAADGFHPSTVTYGLWAEQATKALIAAD